MASIAGCFLLGVSGVLDARATDATTTVKPTAPVITSSAAAAGTAGKPFSYRIVTSGSPAIYRATGLPFEFVINCVTGEISGMPVTARRVNITVQATNATGTHSTVIALIVSPSKGS